MKSKTVFFLAFFFVTVSAPALEVVKLSTVPVAAIVFSGVIEVKGISWRKNAVVMPVTEYKERTYEDIKLLSKGLYAKIEACLSKGVCKNPPGAEPKISVTGVKMLKSKTRLANADTAFDGELLVTAGVMNSSREPGGLWIGWPEDFKINDSALKAKAEKLIKEAYAKALKNPRKKQ
ncbi:MAG: hypothetical protein NTX59_12280 [Elusimicrobia bacterium]|nr:hypothetical protein [Elusimicrobiota bacterium]